MNTKPVVHRFGAATVTRVDETTFSLPRTFLFPDAGASGEAAPQADAADASVDLNAGHFALRTHLWVLEIDGKTIVVDTGIGNAKSRPFSALFDKLDNPVPERLAAAGFRPESVDYVLLTHLHVDHVGWNTWNRNGEWVPVFPNARYMFSRAELAFFDTPAGAPRRMVYEDSVRPLIDAGRADVVDLVGDEGAQILDGIRFVPTPGHSIGHMAVEVLSQGEMALFSGDVMHSPVQVHAPQWSSTFCLDPDMARTSRTRLLQHAADHEATLFAAHFPETSAGRVNRVGDGFAWVYRRVGAD